MNGYKIVLLKAILCFIGCRKVNGYAPEYVDCAGKINWPDVKTHASPFSILKQTLKIASCDLDKKFVIKQYNQIRDGLRNELFHGKGTGNVDIIKLKNAIIAYEWLYENFQKEINKPRN